MNPNRVGYTQNHKDQIRLEEPAEFWKKNFFGQMKQT